MADLHSHLLPDVDDGAKTLEQSIRVLTKFWNEDVTDVCLTPHLSTTELISSEVLAQRMRIHESAFRALRHQPSNIPRLYRGVELMLDGSLEPGTSIPESIRLAGSRYLLVEFPPNLSAQAIRGLLSQVVDKKIVPLVAHAERYRVGWPAEVFAWRDLGAAIQVDATTLARGHGPRAERAIQIVEAGLADILAADNHGDARTLAVASLVLRSIGGEVQENRLLRANPHAILRDKALESVPPLSFRHRKIKRIIYRVRRWFGAT